jgi:hypothetical protein
VEAGKVGGIVASVLGFILGVVILIAVGVQHEKGVVAKLKTTYWYVIGGVLVMTSIAGFVAALTGKK